MQADVELIPVGAFCFVSAGFVMDDHLDRRVRPRTENVTIVKATVNVTNISVTNNVVVNASFNVQAVEKVTKKKVEKVALQPVADAVEADKARSMGRAVIYVPHVAELGKGAGTAATVHPAIVTPVAPVPGVTPAKGAIEAVTPVKPTGHPLRFQHASLGEVVETWLSLGVDVRQIGAG